MRKQVSSILLLGLFCHSAQAGNFYITVGAGDAFTNTSQSFTSDSNSMLFFPTSVGTSLFSLPNVNWQDDFSNGFDTNIALGYQFTSNFRTDFEFLYQQMNRNIYGNYGWKEVNATTTTVFATSRNNPIASATTPLHMYSLLTNAYYDFANSTKWVPFLGGGIGIAWASSDSTTRDDILVVDDPTTPIFETAPVSQKSPSISGTAFAWQFKTGVEYKYSHLMSFILQYRLFSTSPLKANGSTITSNPNTENATIFYINSHNVAGLLTNAIDINVRFDV